MNVNNTMNGCAITTAKTKLALNIMLGIWLVVTDNPDKSLAWKANLLLCAYLTYRCHGVLDIPALILVATYKRESYKWNIAYILYIFGFTYSQGFPILGAVGVLLPFVASGMGRDQYTWDTYRLWSVIFTALILLHRAKLSLSPL
jgi:hypothetical protein